MSYDLSMNGMMHRAFLRDFDRISDQVRTDRWGPAVNRWRLASSLLREHHKVEDEHLWPAMLAEITDPGDRATVEAMEAEHEALEGALDACEEDFAGARPADQQQRDAVVRHLQELSQVLRRHTVHEEASGEALVQRYVSPEQFKAFVKASRSSANRMVVFPWVADGADQTDVEKVWGILPGPVRLFLKPRMERAYQARLAG